MSKQIYIEKTVSLWGGNNGEVNMELEDGTVLTFYAFELFRDLPSITKMCFNEVAVEKNNMRDKYKELAKFITE
jgi:hypothetical protein